ncbi:hypothetical protein A0H81_04124 [Grifola frondosa]|uniref:Uncharacterized protein n=1 Tax=Grifola frondosa TaxID=5627 RepID=A0A1C7MF36_GRIFR|nr:hypothetical protein A0H81_04124 [Grifola frondosa]
MPKPSYVHLRRLGGAFAPRLTYVAQLLVSVSLALFPRSVHPRPQKSRFFLSSGFVLPSWRKIVSRG